MKRRHEPIRCTVSCDRREVLDDDDDGDANITLVLGKNTNRDMHGKNPLYAICIYCNTKFNGSLVQHYVKNHPDREVPISRLSPHMATRLKEQVEIFHQDDKMKITGLCYFCDEMKTFLKFGWQCHLISHTGEKMFNCSKCHAQFKTKIEHDGKVCKGNVANVVGIKEGLLVGYMCNDCNYFQFSRNRLYDHLKNEHGFQSPSHNFMEIIVVKTKNE